MIRSERFYCKIKLNPIKILKQKDIFVLLLIDNYFSCLLPLSLNLSIYYQFLQTYHYLSYFSIIFIIAFGIYSKNIFFRTMDEILDSLYYSELYHEELVRFFLICVALYADTGLTRRFILIAFLSKHTDKEQIYYTNVVFLSHLCENLIF